MILPIYKANQLSFNMINKSIDDILHPGDYKVITDVNKIIQCSIDYFMISMDKNNIIYPSKSYSVAIIYGILIEKYFNVPFFDSIDDDFLFVGTDMFFKPYSKSKYIYDEIIKNVFDTKLEIKSLNVKLPQINTTINYFKQEFYI